MPSPSASITAPKSALNPWLSVERYRKLYLFLGPRVVHLLIFGVLVGLSLFVMEVAFAYGLQAFLLAIGVMSPEAVRVPSWIPISNLKLVLFYILGTGTIRGLLQWAQLYMQGAANEEMHYLQRTRLIRWAFHSESVSSSEITTLFGDRVNRASTVVLNAQGLTVQITSAFLLGASLLYIFPMLTIVAGAALLFIALGMRWTDRKIRESGEGMAHEWDKTNHRMLMSIKNLLLMQIYGTQSEEEAKTQANLKTYLGHSFSFYRYSGLKYAVIQISGVILICVITLAARKGPAISPGTLLSYFYLFVRFLQTFSSVTLSLSSLTQNLPQARMLANWWAHRSFDGLHNARRIKSSTGHIPPLPHAVEWHVSHVSFTYPGATEPTIKDMSLTIEPGKALVITGPSGVGKSTLLNLLLGGLSASTGSVTIKVNGKSEPLEAVRPQLLESIGYVGAESFLVEGTIYENLVYGLRRTPSESEVSNALIKAECQFVHALPKGLQHHLTEQGQGLSAGQKQRISLARALIRSPKALILDEATANLDSTIEAKLLDTFAALKGQMTIIAVTHRPTVLKIADQHLNLDDGNAGH